MKGPVKAVVEMTLDGTGNVFGTITDVISCNFDEEGNVLPYELHKSKGTIAESYTGSYENGVIELGSGTGRYYKTHEGTHQAKVNVDIKETKIVKGETRKVIIYQTLKGKIDLKLKR